MKVIIEGPDGSGKSTLCGHIANRLGWQVQRGRGPEKYPGEINDRAIEFMGLLMDPKGPQLFDRHPCISHPIYSQFTEVSKLNQSITDSLYTSGVDKLIIYCRGDRSGLGAHIEKSYDTESHVKAISRYHASICQMYDEWALSHAHLIYRKGQTGMDYIVNVIKGAM